MISRALRPRLLPLLHQRPRRPLTLLQHPRRPRLPPLLRHHHPATATPHLTQHPRLLSARTRAYLLRESLLAARLVVAGYTLLFALSLAALLLALAHTEATHPTPPTLPPTTRLCMALARVLHDLPAPQTTLAVSILTDTLSRLPPDPPPPGFAAAAHLLAQLLEHLARYPEARTWYLRALAAPDTNTETRVAAALRASRIAAFLGDPHGAEQALLHAVAATAAHGDSSPALRARTELAALYSRCGRGPEALSLLTAVLAARRASPQPTDPADPRTAAMPGDPCAVAGAMAYIGEVAFALGARGEGVAWTRGAWEVCEPLAEARGRCRECAVVAAGNLLAMAAAMGEEGVREGVEVWRGRLGRVQGIRTARGP